MISIIIILLSVNTINCIFIDDILQDEDTHLSTAGIIDNHGYPAALYNVLTEDGYILTLHRIPYSKYASSTRPGQPVFLQHGLFDSSAGWVLNGNNSLAFMLSDAGYDVWMGNSRGSVYSRSHIKYLTSDPAFWDFSWEQMGMYDLPAALNFVARMTGKPGEIIYIGHSMGTTIFFVYAIENPHLRDTVKMMVAMTPAVYMNDVKSKLVHTLVPYTNLIMRAAQFLGYYEILPSTTRIKRALTLLCSPTRLQKCMCTKILAKYIGQASGDLNYEQIPVQLAHIPTGGSAKTITHFAQEINSGGCFQKYDYGLFGNLRQYCAMKPPQYDLRKVELPVMVLSGGSDGVIGKKDATKLSENLPQLISHHSIENYNHADFIWAKSARKLVYEPLLESIKMYGSTSFFDRFKF